MKIQEHISLKDYNTFGIDVKARFFCEIRSVQELRDALQCGVHPEILILSGGSNMLLTQDLDALVLYINIQGKELLREDRETVSLKVMAGENWHELVVWTLEQGYGGLENLSLIPGKTGTAPVQNIGAYGVEIKDRLEQCTALHRETLQPATFSREECGFGYRDSFFKNEGKGKYIILSVTLRLTKTGHQLETSYGAIGEELQKNKVVQPTITDVSKAVIAIRNRKLPDPKVLGNSGSFFKNPVLDKQGFQSFKELHPEAPYFEVSENEYKIPAGWLIEQCGFKGKRYGDAGVHKDQALVLVNYGNATGKELMALATTIQKAVLKRYGIRIIPEVNIIK
jgi:UDP-N-acetylmuramate dehydrogenase